MSGETIRVAVADDAAAILRIYSPAVIDSAVSFELEPPTLEEVRGRIVKTLAQYPWLVFERGREVLGYAYASAYRPRPAYQWSTEVTVYVDSRARRCGIAKALYQKLFAILSQQNYFNAFAVITLPNPASVVLHEGMGFRPVGVLHNAGYKLERWRDVGLWQLELQRPHAPFGPPRPFSGEMP